MYHQPAVQSTTDPMVVPVSLVSVAVIVSVGNVSQEPRHGFQPQSQPPAPGVEEHVTPVLSVVQGVVLLVFVNLTVEGRGVLLIHSVPVCLA